MFRTREDFDLEKLSLFLHIDNITFGKLKSLDKAVVCQDQG